MIHCEYTGHTLHFSRRSIVAVLLLFFSFTSLLYALRIAFKSTAFCLSYAEYQSVSCSVRVEMLRRSFGSRCLSGGLLTAQASFYAACICSSVFLSPSIYVRVFNLFIFRKVRKQIFHYTFEHNINRYKTKSEVKRTEQNRTNEN